MSNKDKDIIEEESKGFDYKHKASFKLSNKFKQKFYTQTAGGPTLSADGLVALGHVKGMWKMDSEIVQFPNAENGNMCICKATIGGYDWDPIENKIIRVEYTDIGDASPTNCKGPVAASYIRMASTRAIGRALRKYTNVDMLCTEELGEEDISTESMEEFATDKTAVISKLIEIKGIIEQKQIPPDVCMKILTDNYHTDDFNSLTVQQAEEYMNIISNYIPPKSN